MRTGRSPALGTPDIRPEPYGYKTYRGADAWIRNSGRGPGGGRVPGSRPNREPRRSLRRGARERVRTGSRGTDRRTDRTIPEVLTSCVRRCVRNKVRRLAEPRARSAILSVCRRRRTACRLSFRRLYKRQRVVTSRGSVFDIRNRKPRADDRTKLPDISVENSVIRVREASGQDSHPVLTLPKSSSFDILILKFWLHRFVPAALGSNRPDRYDAGKADRYGGDSAKPLSTVICCGCPRIYTCGSTTEEGGSPLQGAPSTGVHSVLRDSDFWVRRRL